MQNFGKTDTALTEAALIAALHRQMDALEIICETDPAETWQSFCEGVKRLVALAQEAHRRGFLPERQHK